jgi:hypothetical protein
MFVANAVANADAGTGYFATSAAVDDWKVVVGEPLVFLQLLVFF